MSLHVSYNSFHIIAFIWQEYYLNIFTIRYKGKNFFTGKDFNI